MKWRFAVYLKKEFKVRVITLFIKLGRRMNEYSEKFNKEIENIRKYKTKVITELKNTLEEFTKEELKEELIKTG